MSITPIASKQRQLIADMDTADQISTLRSLIKNPPQNSRVVQLSPELAKYVLEQLNIGNRSQKPKQIAKYAADMKNDDWSLTGVPIVFGSHGYLLDGQNRLAACVRADVPFTTHAVFGVEPDSFVHFDIGKNRTGADVFTIMGVPYPKETGIAVRYIKAWSLGKTDTRTIQMSNDNLRDYYSNLDATMLELAIKNAKKVNRVVKIPTAILTALFYTAWQKGHLDKVKLFFADLEKGFGSGPRAPVNYLLTELARIHFDKTITVTSHMHSIMLVRSWQNYKWNKASTKKDLRVVIGEGLPEV